MYMYMYMYVLQLQLLNMEDEGCSLMMFPMEKKALDCLGKGFDLTSDFRMKFAKGLINGGRLVVIDEMNKRDIMVPGGVTIKDVSEDIRCDKGDRVRFKSDVLPFNQVCSSFLFSNYYYSDMII